MRLVQFMIGSYGGAERFFVRLSSALQDRGLKQLIVTNDHPQLVADVRSAGLEHMMFNPSILGGTIDAFVIDGVCRMFSTDIIVAWMNRAGRRVSRGDYVKIGRLGGYYPVKNYRNCNHLVVNTPLLLENCLGQGWPREKLSVISNFTEDFSSAPRMMKPGEGGTFTICALGRFDPWKGFDTLLEAVARMDNVNLILAGDGVEKGNLQEQARRLNILDRVRFLGWLDDRASLFQQADVCVVPSTHEPLGNVILEAWSSGCPVVAAASEGPAWLIENGKNGLLFEPNHVEQLVAALTNLRTNPQSASQLGSAGRSKWGQEFQEDVICAKYIDLFDRALHQNRNAAAGRRRA